MKEEKKQKKVDVPYPILNKEQEIKIFKSLSHMSYKAAAKDNGLDIISPESDDIRLTSWAHAIARKIMKAPQLWGITQDSVDIIRESIDSRSIKPNNKLRADVALENESFRDRLDNMRDKVADMIMAKLKIYGRNSKTLEGISVKDLKDLLSTAIDKGRLLRGESTENIIKLSRIDTDKMSPEEALRVIMKAREALIESKK